MTARAFQTLEVAAVRPETAEALVVAFRPPADPAFAFHAGQYLTLRAEIAGACQQRCYSICSTPGDPLIEVAIKRVPGGRFSEWAHATLRPGMTVEVMAPEGRFGARVDEAPRGAGRYLAIAAGSGITPILSLGRTLLATEPEAEFTLVYGNRSRDAIMFREALDDLKDRHLARFSLVHILSREASDVDLFHGRIDAARLARLAGGGAIAPAAADVIFICGPGDFIDACRAGIVALGAAPERIQTERFLVAPGAASPLESASPAVAAGVEVEAIVDGARLAFTLLPEDASLIVAAERAGIELPSSCRGGMCCTCRARMVEGAAEMAVNYSLEPWEQAAGFLLACQARPTTPRLVLDFDAV